MAIQVVVRETGEVKSLSIICRKSGCEWVMDLIGNRGAMDQFEKEVDEDGEGTGRWVADAGTIQWWQSYISNLEAIEDAIESLHDELAEVFEFGEIQAILQRVRDAIGDANDVESELSVAMGEIQKIRKQYGLPEEDEG